MKSRFVYTPGLFVGREKLDIIKRLHDMGTHHILTQIWKYLSVQDVSKVLQVSVISKIVKKLHFASETQNLKLRLKNEVLQVEKLA